MPEHLISVNEAIAMLETIGASKEIVRKFSTQVGGVLSQRPNLGDEHVIVTSLHGAKSGEPGVNLQIGTVRLQLDVKSARRVALNILGGAEAAISDTSVMKLLADRFGIETMKAAAILIDLREIRQGVRGIVFE